MVCASTEHEKAKLLKWGSCLTVPGLLFSNTNATMQDIQSEGLYDQPHPRIRVFWVCSSDSLPGALLNTYINEQLCMPVTTAEEGQGFYRWMVLLRLL